MQAQRMAWLVLILTIAFALVPFLTGGFGGYDPDLFPVPQDNPPIVPAGWAFAIWGVIYLWLVVSALFGALRRAEVKIWRRARVPLGFSLLIGIAWIPVAQWSPILATMMLWSMCGSALVALSETPKSDYLFLRAPVALYAGWLVVASSVSLGLLLAGYGLVGEETAAIIALLVLLYGMLRVQRRYPEAIPFPLAGLWALAAIVIPNLPVDNLPVEGLCLFGGGWLAYRMVSLNVRL